MALMESSMTALHGWHPGELALQDRLNLTSSVQTAYHSVRDHLPAQHRTFHTSNIAFVPITTLDSTGRPWTSLLSSNAGTAGFISSSSQTEMRIDADVWEGDPITHNIKDFKTSFSDDEGVMLAGLGIEWASRRRNKFAGRFFEAKREGNHFHLALRVTQTLGNCPKYISIRTVLPSATAPELVYHQPNLPSDGRLPDELVQFIHRSDTVFVGTSYVAKPSDESLYPSHLGVNHRGGRPGFVRVRNNGRTIVLPDYSGNRFMQSLGNIQATPLAALTILDFETGDILYMTGQAENLIGKDAEAVMPRTNVITLITLTGYTYVRNAMPVRQVPNSSIIPSPYSPPVRYLAEEKPSERTLAGTILTLGRIQIHSNDLATFWFIPSAPVAIRPGQAAIIDSSSFTGGRGYQHMAKSGDESTVNDDGIRTWTVSGRSTPGDDTSAIMITMREKLGGFVTSRLFAVTRKTAAMMPALLDDATPMGLTMPLLGIDGDFVLPKEVEEGAEARRLLWVAGGVGITPFLSMLRGIIYAGGSWDIVLVLAARRGDVEVLGQLVADAVMLNSSVVARSWPKLTLRAVIYSRGLNPNVDLKFGTLPDESPVQVVVHSERLTRGDLALEDVDATGREVFICGPLVMEELAVQGLQEVGIKPGSIHRENFAY